MVQNKLVIAKNYHITPTEIDYMQYWEYEYFLDAINNEVEEEKRQQEEQNQNSPYKMPSMSDFKMPSVGDFKMPDFKMPSI